MIDIHIDTLNIDCVIKIIPYFNNHQFNRADETKQFISGKCIWLIWVMIDIKVQ